MPSGEQRSRPEPSLRARALRMLARREHSRAELARKLAPHAESAEQIESLLDGLAAAGWLSNERFAESLVRRRAQVRGTAVIRHEMRAHHLERELVQAQVEALQRTEFARARALWERRFGAPAAGMNERARQMRFLLTRGFSADVVRRVVGAPHDDDPS